MIEGVVTATVGLLHGAHATGADGVRVAIGCAGGRHRAPALAYAIGACLARMGVPTYTEHLHLDQPAVTPPTLTRED